MFKDRTAILFILTTFATGLCGSFFYPLSSVFIVEALGASPAMLSAYMLLAVVSSIVVSQFIAYYSDKGWRRKRIILLSFTCYLVTVVSFAFIRNYYVAICIAVLFGSISGAVFGQVFAMGREYADAELKENSATFLSTMRAGMAVAWVFGPPGAFILKGAYGFSYAFLTAGAITAVTIVVVYFWLPEQKKGTENHIELEDDSLNERHAPTVARHIELKQRARGSLSSITSPVPWYKRLPIVLFCLSMLMTFAANNLYVTVMPLYLSQELIVKASWVGMIFGTAALCEIPIMLGAGWLSLRYGPHRVLAVGLAFGAIFYLGVINSSSVWHLLSIQIFNGVFIGVAATLGMVVLQDMMSDQLGVASTLFSNVMQAAVLVSSVTIGFVGEFYSYYSAFYVSFSGIILALGLLFIARRVSLDSEETTHTRPACE